MLNMINQGRQLLSQSTDAFSAWLSAHQETVLLAICAVLLASAVWIISGQWHERRAGKREMEQRRKQLELKAYEKWLDLTLDMYAKDEISDKQQAYLDYKVAKAFGHPELMPKKSQDFITRRVKSFLKWKRYSMDPQAVELREKHLKPAPIPGPKPGEDMKVVDLKSAMKPSVKDRLAKAFSRKKAA